MKGCSDGSLWGAARTLALTLREVGSLRRVPIAGLMCPDSQPLYPTGFCVVRRLTGKGDSRGPVTRSRDGPCERWLRGAVGTEVVRSRPVLDIN